MRERVFKFLSNYSTDTFKIDRLIISTFLKLNNVVYSSNQNIAAYVIKEEDADDKSVFNDFCELVQRELTIFSFEELIVLFEFVISPADRVINGAIYTPLFVRDFIIESCIKNVVIDINFKIADIACGCGGFLLTAAKQIKRITGISYFEIYRNNIYGLDIQEYSSNRSKLLLTILALIEGEEVDLFLFNIHTGDALNYKWVDEFNVPCKFSAIVGNPPYVSSRNLEDETRLELKKWSVCLSGNPDLYIPFFQIGLELLAPNGVLGFITMNTFFKSLNGRALRQYFHKNSYLIKILDFGAQQVFKSKSTYTCVSIIHNKTSDIILYHKLKDTSLHDKLKFTPIPYSQLKQLKGWNLEDNTIVERIESIGSPFGKVFKTRHGIATLKNDVYIFKPIAEDDNFFYLKDKYIFPIEKGICRKIVNSNKLSRGIDFEDLYEQLIFPYEGLLKPKILSEEQLKAKYPNTFVYLLSKKDILAKRDKGKGDYEQWFAFGRTQSLDALANKLFFPKYSDVTPSFILSSDPMLMFYNGLAVVAESSETLRLAQKIMASRLFWYYIKSTSKPYSSNYYSLNGNYINNFGVFNFSKDDIEYLLKEENKNRVDSFIESLYGVNLDK